MIMNFVDWDKEVYKGRWKIVVMEIEHKKR